MTAMNVLAIGAHPDDIEYGCGGTLTKYAQRGHAVHLFVASDGARGGEAAVRRREQDESAVILGARKVFWGDYPDTELPRDPGSREVRGGVPLGPSAARFLIPHSRPSLGDDDARAVARVVRGGQIAQGPEVAAFESEVALRLGVSGAAAVSSGTAALELALRALALA